MEAKNSFKREVIGLVMALIILLIIVGSFVGYSYWPIFTGKKIVLATRPVDPFDPFRGQYMNIGYEISEVNAEGFREGDLIYVLLKEDEQGIWRKVSVFGVKPDSGDFIRGKINRIFGERANVLYGIEQFFFEKGAEISTSNITIEVSVASSGRAKIVQLLQNGKPIEIKYQEFDIMD